MGRMRAHVLCSFFQRTASLGNLGPIVTFTFDDFPRTAVTAGSTILDQLAIKATYYAAMGLMESTNDLGEQFHRTDLQSLIERGHEVALHGFGHLSARKTPLQDFLRDVEIGETAIQKWAPTGTSNNFAFPYGEATLAAKAHLGRRMDSCRGTCGGLNGPNVDLNLLRANHLYGDMNEAAAARQLIVQNQRRGGWLIFYTHDVAPAPSPFGCTPELLEDTASFAVQRGAKLMTIADVVKKLGNSTNN